MTDLVEFLTARLDEEAQAVREVDEPRNAPHYWLETDADPHGRRDQLLVHPARVLAEVAAKRAILDRYKATEQRADEVDVKRAEWPLSQEADDEIAERVTLEECCRYLAQPYRDHPDFDPAWETA